MLSLLYGPTLTSIHDYWKNHSFDFMDLCRQSDVEMYLKLTAGVLIAAGTTCCEGIEERTVGPHRLGWGCWEGAVDPGHPAPPSPRGAFLAPSSPGGPSLRSARRFIYHLAYCPSSLRAGAIHVSSDHHVYSMPAEPPVLSRRF